MPVTETKKLIRVGHSPDPDDAFMFHALTNGCVDTGSFMFTHELVDIETLNERAFARNWNSLQLASTPMLSCTTNTRFAVVVPLWEQLWPDGGCQRGLFSRKLRDKVIAIPGKLTSAFLALRLCLGQEFEYVVVPFDEIIPATVQGEYQGKKLDAGLIIHEGQLTYSQNDLQLVVDMGVWWHELTGLPLPLGANGIRKDLGPKTIEEVQKLLYKSIKYGLDHHEEALDYALQYGRDLDRGKADHFVGMYVNDWTLDFGPRGREAVTRFLAMGHEQGILPEQIKPEFVSL